MNKKGQAETVRYAFYIFIFIIVWVIGLSKLMNTAGELAIEGSGATGGVAFFLGNINLIVLFCVLISLAIIGTIAYTSGAGQ